MAVLRPLHALYTPTIKSNRHVARPNRQFFSLLTTPNYRRTWLIGGLTGVARWLEFLALALFTYQLTGTATYVALLAIVRLAPYVLIGFFVGTLTDRIDRRFWLITALSIILSTSIGLALFGVYGQITFPVVLLATAITGIFMTTDMPIRRRLMVDSVGDRRVPAALGFDNITNFATRGLGPLIGGATYQWLGIEGVFAINAVFYAACLGLALTLRETQKQTNPTGKASDTLTPASVASRPPTRTVLSKSTKPATTSALLANPTFLIILSVTTVYNIACIPFLAMLPVIVQKEFALSPSLTGALAACEGIGGIVGSLCVGLLARERTLLGFYFFGPFLYLSVILALSFHVTVAGTIAALLLISFGAACFSATQYALVYLHASPHLRGRATGLLAICIGSGTIGLYFAGQLFSRVSSDKALMIMAVGGLVPLTLLGMLAAMAPLATHRPKVAR